MTGGLQKYTKSGDIVGKKTVGWWDKNVIKKVLHNRSGIVLDIGAGNGRHYQLYKNYFNFIFGVDRHVNVNPIFNYKNVCHAVADVEKIDFIEYNEDKLLFDVIFMFGSMYLIQDKKSLIKKMISWLNTDGIIVVSDDVKRILNKAPKNNYNIVKLCKNENVHIEQFITDPPRSLCSVIRRRE